MFRNTVLLIVFSFAVGLVGCRSCWGPFDHCQPTFVPEAGDQCMGDLYRNGSVLGGMERRGDCCGGCSACAGGSADAGYGDYGFISEDAYSGNMENYSAETAAPVAQTPVGTAQQLPNISTAGTNGSGSINDYLPDSSLRSGRGI